MKIFNENIFLVLKTIDESFNTQFNRIKKTSGLYPSTQWKILTFLLEEKLVEKIIYFYKAENTEITEYKLTVNGIKVLRQLRRIDDTLNYKK